MTVSSTDNSTPFVGDGSTTVFPFTWRVDDATSIHAYIDGAEVTTGITKNLNASGVGGDVTFDTAPILDAAGKIVRATPLTQPMNIREESRFDNTVIENAFDKMALGLQYVNERVNLAFTLPITSLINPALAEPTTDEQVMYYDAGTDTILWGTVAELYSSGGVGTGNVTGPVSSTDGRPVLFDGATGRLLKEGAYPLPAALGTAGQTLVVNSGATALEFAAGGGSGMLAVSPSVRLTLESGVPISSTNQTAKTTLYSTAGMSKLWTGSAWAVYERAELSITLASLTAALPYAVYEYLSGSTPTLELEAWTNTTTRATAITFDTATGLYHKAGDKTRAWRGDILILATGQCEDSTSYRGVFNAYNRVPRNVLAIDPTDSWAYGTASWRSFNGSTALGVGKVQIMVGQATFAGFDVQMDGSGQPKVGIGINSTTVNSGQTMPLDSTYYNYCVLSARARGNGLLRVGENSVYPLENATTSTTFYGDGGLTAGLMQMGLVGEVLM